MSTKYVFTAILVGGLSIALAAWAQVSYPSKSLPPSTKAPSSKGESAKPKKEYLSVTVTEINEHAKDFEGKDIEVADLFGRMVPDDRYPPEVVNGGFTPQKYFLFRTQRGNGSNMLCFAPRTKDTEAFFAQPLVSDSPVFMRGKVGPIINLDYGPSVLENGPVTAFYVDQIYRGTSAPETAAATPARTEEKPVKVTIVWDANNRRTYVIKKPKTPQEFPNPLDPQKKITISVDY